MAHSLRHFYSKKDNIFADEQVSEVNILLWEIGLQDRSVFIYLFKQSQELTFKHFHFDQIVFRGT